MSRNGDRMWTYATGIYLFALDHGKFRLAAIFGVLCGISVLLCGGLIGSLVDRTARLKAVKISLAVQNLCVAIAATAFYLYLWYCGISIDWSNKELQLKQQKTYVKQALHFSWEAMIVILGVMALLASTAMKIAIEKDWVIIVADTKSGLASLNAVVRSIDLSCKILAPIAVGGIMSAFGLQVSAIFIAAWNIVSLFLEYALLKKVYNLVPRLAIKGTDDAVLVEEEVKVQEITDKDVEMEEMLDKNKLNKTESNSQNVEEEIPLNDTISEKEVEGKENEGEKIEAKVEYLRPKKIKKSCVQLVFGELIILIKGWKIYMKQRVVCAGLALACLYMTVLGFDSVTVAYIYSQGVNEALTGVCQGLGGLIGLWMADLVVTQLIQENVVETERGLVNGVQNSLNSLLDMLKFILVLFFATPEVFGYLIILSYIFVSLGCILYASYSYKMRGHLIPRRLKSFLLCRSQKTPNANSSPIYIGPPLQKKSERSVTET
ncbi:DgyrCDS11765 [Dimorphilus gyrociliatus]|uniref:Solute carrier family 40 member n=1 Tax=Dimorphilus gyrociliatus TaxID=2664684 RepID=A0A7I8W4F3_9ANNE|nr:DgyrCDS11765 [Dimorphilus gyrociliatus]